MAKMINHWAGPWSIDEVKMVEEDAGNLKGVYTSIKDAKENFQENIFIIVRHRKGSLITVGHWKSFAKIENPNKLIIYVAETPYQHEKAAKSAGAPTKKYVLESLPSWKVQFWREQGQQREADWKMYMYTDPDT